MPSSGARSGTRPSRSERGAGTGRVGKWLLACGCEVDELDLVSTKPNGVRIFRCPQHGLTRKKN